MPDSKMKSGFKKLVSVIENGTDGIEQGMNNFKTPVVEIETLAEARTLTCISCPNYQIEPIGFFKVTDIRIPELTDMFCNDCGCTLSYKLRQSINKCALWEK